MKSSRKLMMTITTLWELKLFCKITTCGWKNCKITYNSLVHSFSRQQFSGVKSPAKQFVSKIRIDMKMNIS